jgi:hypothetical protein
MINTTDENSRYTDPMAGWKWKATGKPDSTVLPMPLPLLASSSLHQTVEMLKKGREQPIEVCMHAFLHHRNDCLRGRPSLARGARTSSAMLCASGVSECGASTFRGAPPAAPPVNAQHAVAQTVRKLASVTLWGTSRRPYVRCMAAS